MNIIEGAELNVYTQYGEDFSVDLSPTQLFVLIKILGIELSDNKTFSCFSDETLKKLIKLEANPLNLKKI